MSRTTTRRPGRLRAIAVTSALAVSLVAGAAAPALADDTVPPAHAQGPTFNDHNTEGLSTATDARSDADAAPWNRGEDEGGVTPQGLSWF